VRVSLKSEMQMLEPWANVNDRRRRWMKKAALTVEDQGAMLERQESPGPLVMWLEFSEPHRMRQEPPGPHVVW
jgi:hypothetical protein